MENIENFGVKEAAVVLAVTLVVVMTLVTMTKKKRHHLPPGPWGLPLVGYLPFFGPNPHLTFTELRKKYGDVISIRMGSWPAVVICGSDAIKEALVTKKDDFAGRPAFTTARLLGNSNGFTFLPHIPTFKVHRKIVSNVLHKYTNARKNPVEKIILSEAKLVVQEFLSHKNCAFSPLAPLDLAVYSIIYQLVFDRHQDVRNDADFMEMLQNLKDFANFNSAGNPVDVMPWLRFIFPSKASRFLELVRMSKVVRDKKIKEHESTFDEDNLRDITDGLIHAGNNLTAEEKALGIGKEQVLGNLSTIFGAGSETTASTLKWCVGLMAAFPEVQEEIFHQIHSVVGQSRDVTLADRGRLPVVEAAVYEILRYSGVVPFSLPHSTTRDTALQGHPLPQGTVVLVHLASVFTDPTLWGDPREFRPRRFLDPGGQLCRARVEQTGVFSGGRRRCVGEALARTELFLFLATLLQRVRISRPPGQPGWQLKPVVSLTVTPEPFHVCQPSVTEGEFF